ncbi:hypothetical protein [Mucilaginibacter sp.]|uniref:hypothetical protein n=1 Tax=Mucilaginibacter sp. TaxID=1882438 RepID=UPI00261CCCD6|nr:hypothetical protein [Mucilaginibacter sp.]
MQRYDVFNAEGGMSIAEVLNAEIGMPIAEVFLKSLQLGMPIAEVFKMWSLNV